MIYMTFWERQNTRDGEQITGCQDPLWGGAFGF